MDIEFYADQYEEWLEYQRYLAECDEASQNWTQPITDEQVWELKDWEDGTP